MTIIILSSTTDEAGRNIHQHLVKHFTVTADMFEGHPVYRNQIGSHDVLLTQTSLHSVETEHIDDRLKRDLSIAHIDAIIYATKHASKSGVKSFCVHTQGNWGTADLGGDIGVVGIVPTVLKNRLYRELCKQAIPGFEVVNEATHHGPTLSCPSVFIEIGSTATEWSVAVCGQIIEQTLMTVLQAYGGEPHTPHSHPTIFLIGGTHTCSNINDIVRDGLCDLGHACASYAVDGLTSQMITDAMARCSTLQTIVIDWKSLNAAQRNRVLELVKEAGFEAMRLKEWKERNRQQISS